MRVTVNLLSRSTAKLSLFLAAFVSIVTLPTVAQISTVTVNGTVTDSSGAAVPGATLTATDTSTGIQSTTTADAGGRYNLLNVKPGTYDVQASAPGFGTSVRRGQVLLVGQTIALDFALQVGGVSQTVQVEAETTQTIPTTGSVVQRIVEPQEIDNLPSISRSFSDLAALSPGVTVTGGSTTSNSGGTVTIGNSTSFQVGWIVDNAVAENTFYGGQMSKFAQDWIQEFSVVSQQAPAEYGEAAGGFVNAVTRSGGNQLHGRAYFYYQNAALNAAPYFSTSATKPPFDLERGGGMVGGPIKKDKVFYFGGYEYFHSLQSVPLNFPAGFGVGSQSGIFPQPNQSHIGMAKVDWQKSEADKFTFRFNTEYDFAPNSGIGGTITLGNGTNITQRHWLPMGSWTRVISPSKLNQLSGMYGRYSYDDICNYYTLAGNFPGYPAQPGSTLEGNPVNWLAQISYSQTSPPMVTGCPVMGWALNHYISWRESYITDTLSITHGNHEYKFGIEPGYQQVWWGGIHTGGDGSFAINGSNPFNASNPTTYPISDLMNGYAGPQGERLSQYGPGISFFAQDSFKITPNLTLNYGLRYRLDFLQSMYSNEKIEPAIKSGESACGCGPIAAPLVPMHNDYFNLAPRVGFAWTPFHDSGKTVLRGGLGIFYDETHSAVIAVAYGQSIGNAYPINVNASRPSLNPYCYGNACGATPPTIYQNYVEEVLAYSLATYTIPNFTLGTYKMPNGGPTYTIPAPTIVVGGAVQPAPTSSGTIVDDSNLKTPGEMQVSMGIGHDFSNSFSVSADYVYINGFQEYITRNTNVSTQGTLLNPLYGSIWGVGNGGALKYNSVRIQGAYRNRRGDAAQVAYTLASAWNNSYGSFGAAATSALATDPYNYNVDWGPSGTPLNTLTANSLLHIPFGIEFAPIFTFTSAQPFQATTTQTSAVPGCLSYYNQCYPAGYSRNSLRGDYTYMLSARLSKTLKITEGKSATFYFEGYNIPNHGNFGTDITSSVLSPAFLKPNNTVTSMRQLQVGARFDL